MDSRLQVPFVCEFVAMRWSYEELVVAQAKLNPLTKRQDDAQRADRRHRRAARVAPGRSEAARRLEGNARRPFRSGSAKPARTQAIPGHHRSRFERKNVLRSRGFQERERPDHGRTTLRKPENLRLDRQRRNGTKRLSPRRQAERVFRRRKTLFRRRQPGAEKDAFLTVSVFTFNTAVLIGSSLLLLWLLHWILRRQLEVRRNC